MKLKYYLRGLGIGIIVTALLMGVSTTPANGQGKTPKSQETILEAKDDEDAINIEETGTEIEEIKVSASILKTEENSSELVSELDDNLANVKAEESMVMENVEETNKNGQAEAGELLDQQVAPNWGAGAAEPEDTFNTYLLNIVRGDDSGTVSRKLQNAGIIDNATEFDAFLMQHGYDKCISVGVVEIPMGASWMEVAEKIAGR